MVDKNTILNSLDFQDIFIRNEIHYLLKDLILSKQEDSINYFKDLDGDGIRDIFFSIRSRSMDKLIEYLIEENQYIYISEKFYKDLTYLYNTNLLPVIKKLVGGDIKASIVALDRLDTSILSYLTTKEEVRLIGKSFEKIPNFQYEGETQVSILGIDMVNIKEPILDIGCGRDYKLVRHLRENQLEAYGIDRYNFQEDYLTKKSWLDYEYGFEKWGTIIAHMSFSNHFKRESLKEHGLYMEYGRTYMNILKSLKQYGSFYYTPSLEFIEELLDEKEYHLSYKKLKNKYKVVKISKISG